MRFLMLRGCSKSRYRGGSAGQALLSSRNQQGRAESFRVGYNLGAKDHVLQYAELGHQLAIRP